MRIWRVLFISLISLLLSDLSSAQKMGPDFLDKTHQHKFSAEFLAASYSYAHRFNENATFGFSVMNGFSAQFFLAHSPIKYSTNPDTYYDPGYVDIMDLKLLLFYRCKLSKRFYFDAGPFISITNLVSEADWSNPLSAGLEFSPAVIVWKLHLGISLKGAVNFGTNPTISATYYALYITPIVIGIGF
jgi:hypothetical protein